MERGFASFDWQGKVEIYTVTDSHLQFRSQRLRWREERGPGTLENNRAERSETQTAQSTRKAKFDLTSVTGRQKGGFVNVPSFRFSFRGNMRTYPCIGPRSGGTSECTRSGLCSGGTSAKTTLLENRPSVNPRVSAGESVLKRVLRDLEGGSQKGL